MKNLLLKRSYSLYVTVMLFVLLPAMMVLALNYFILFQAGEFRPIKEIAEDLQDGNTIFASGIHDLRRELNLEIARIRKPEIVAFGSSRPLNFRQEYFSAPFSCACQAVPNLNEGLIYAQNLLAIHQPKIVIFSVDFWWFTTPSGVRPRALVQGTPKATLQKLVKPMTLVADKTITPAQYRDLLRAENDFSKTTSLQKRGLLAITRGMGTRADGSYLGGTRLSDYAHDYYKKWSERLHNAEDFIQTNDRYGPNKLIIEEHITQYAELVKMFQDAGVKVVAVMLPLAPTIYDALEASPDHGHISEISKRIAGYSDEFYDLHNPHQSGLDASDMCEYEDAHHSGDAVFMRSLHAVIQHNPNTSLAKFVKLKELDQLIEAHKGQTIARFDPSLYLAKERDFSGFDCAK